MRFFQLLSLIACLLCFSSSRIEAQERETTPTASYTQTTKPRLWPEKYRPTTHNVSSLLNAYNGDMEQETLVLEKDSQNLADSFINRRPSGIVIINQINAQLTVTTNLEKANWTLLKNNSAVYEGTGSVMNFQIIDGNNYKIVPEQIEGYEVKVSPFSTFTLYPAQTLHASITYKRTFGSLTIQAPFPDGETLAIKLESNEAPPLTVKVKSKGGKIFWQSQPLPTGAYQISYLLPPNYTAIPSENILIKRAERLQLNPKIFPKGGLHVVANIPEAVFLLKTLNGSKVWKGEGREYTFKDIPSGLYLLSFSTEDPDYFIPPKEMKLSLNEKETKEINVVFQIASKLTIVTNIDRSLVAIQKLGGEGRSYQETIFSHSKVFNLPEGRYRVTLSQLPEDSKAIPNLLPPAPVEVILKGLNSEDLNLIFRENTPLIEKERRLNVVAGVGNAGFTLYKLHNGEKALIGHFSGKNTQVTLPSAEQYEIVYDDLPNYQTPEPHTFEINAGEEKTLQDIYKPLLSIVTIPEGKAIIGDATSEEDINERAAKIVSINTFSMGIYEVTNAEYAAWLNSAIKKETISYIKEADKRGLVINQQGELLFKTFEADSYSQISAQLQSLGTPSFMPLAGKDSYPVINVTWYGAIAYCQENECRLPTEAEWEKAASMEPQAANTPLKKYRYGFSRNEIDHTFANYKDNADNIQHFQVLTTPVGFYNGVHSLPLKITHNRQQQTHLAKSPYGNFDMSGNVWEWVGDWYEDAYYANMSENNPKGPPSGTKKVVKGGCYDSLADGVRVTERMGLPPDYSDAYTGFRVAK